MGNKKDYKLVGDYYKHLSKLFERDNKFFESLIGQENIKTDTFWTTEETDGPVIYGNPPKEIAEFVKNRGSALWQMIIPWMRKFRVNNYPCSDPELSFNYTEEGEFIGYRISFGYHHDNILIPLMANLDLEVQKLKANMRRWATKCEACFARHNKEAKKSLKATLISQRTMRVPIKLRPGGKVK